MSAEAPIPNSFQEYEALAQNWEERVKEVTPYDAEKLAQKAFFALSDYYQAQQFDDLERWGERLRQVTNDHGDNTGIQFYLAGGAFIAISLYSATQQFDKLETWGDILELVAISRLKNSRIQRWWARSTVLAISLYGAVQKFDDLEKWGDRLQKVGSLSPSDTEIQLCVARGAANAKFFYRTTSFKSDEKNKKRALIWDKKLRECLNSNNGTIGGVYRKLGAFEKTEAIRILDKWEEDDDFKRLLEGNKDLIKKEIFRELWDAQADVKVLLRVTFSKIDKPRDDEVSEVAKYIDVGWFESLIQVEKIEKKLSPAPLKLNSVSSANDPLEGKVLQRFLDGNPERESNNSYEEAMIVLQSSFSHAVNNLNQFRLYGAGTKPEEGQGPGTGVCLVFGKNFFAKAGDSVSIISSVKKELFERPDTSLSRLNDSSKQHLYWVLYYDSQNRRFTHTPTQCALKVGDNLDKEYPDWAIKKNEIISAALKKVKGIYEKIKPPDKETAWRLLIYLRHLVKDIAFAEEQEMRILQLCPFGDAVRLQEKKDILSIDYLPILSKENKKLEIIAGPKMQNFIAKEILWRNEIKKYEIFLKNKNYETFWNEKKKQGEVLTEEDKIVLLNTPLGPSDSFEVSFSQSEAPLA